MRLAIASVAIALVGSSLTGCTLYFGNNGDDDPPTCGKGEVYPTTAPGAPQYQLRDPYTNQCSYYGGGGGGDCYYDEDCNYICYGEGDTSDGGIRNPDDKPPPQETGSDSPGGGSGWGSGDGSGGGSGWGSGSSMGSGSGGSGGGSNGTSLVPPLPDYPQCQTECDRLEENDCLATPNCQATYSNNDYAYPPDDPTNGMDPDVPIAPTTFAGCYSTGNNYGENISCYSLDANACVHRDDCSPYYDNYGYGLNFSQCAPEPQSTSSCENVNCGTGSHCEQQCYTEDSSDPFTDCVAQCVPDGNSCANVDCAPGYTCVDVCDTMTPMPNGLVPPGQCWASCQPTESCEALDQTACDARGDCTSVYDGEDCTCYPGGYCDCEILTWKRCDSVNAMPL